MMATLSHKLRLGRAFKGVPINCDKIHARHSSTTSAALQRALKRDAPLDIHPEVQHALANQKPIVALETALVTHGVPPPVNYELARKLEGIVRAQGAVPATIGIVEGRVKVGLRDGDLQRLSDTKTNRNLVKVSRRDIGPILALRGDGGTTICSTLIFAHLAGIKVFATGGLGGVHRGAQDTMDISADLHELTRCSVGVVSAGVKSILDIGRTLEYLETLGVPVVTYGKTYDFPAFYCGKSGLNTNWKVNDPRSAADILRSQWRLGLQNGALFAAPLPEEFEAQGAEIQAAIDQAIVESEESGVSKRGKEVTPWLLARVAELTAGKSLQSNIALLENTAVIGSQIAVEYAKIEAASVESVDTPNASASSSTFTTPPPLNPTSPLEPDGNPEVDVPAHKKPAKLIVVGASAIDITARVEYDEQGNFVEVAQTTAPGTVSLTLGGVARNIAEAAHRVLSAAPNGDPHATLLLSPIGVDELAPFLFREHSRLGMRSDGFLRVRNDRTAVCNMVLDAAGSLIGGVADMDIIRDISEETVLGRFNEEKNPALVVMDANMSPSLLASINFHAVNKGALTFFEPTSVKKSTSIFEAIVQEFVSMKSQNYRSPITFASPNILELQEMYRAANTDEWPLLSHRLWWDAVDRFNLGSEWRMDLDQLSRQRACPDVDKGDLSFLTKSGIAQMAVNMLPFFQNIIIKCGERGVIVALRILEENVEKSAWSAERSNPLKRYIVAKSGKEMVVLKHYPAIPIDKEEIVSVTGAGDSLVGTLSACITRDPSLFHDPLKLDTAIGSAQRATILSLHSVRAISPLLGTAGHA